MRKNLPELMPYALRPIAKVRVRTDLAFRFVLNVSGQGACLRLMSVLVLPSLYVFAGIEFS